MGIREERGGGRNSGGAEDEDEGAGGGAPERPAWFDALPDEARQAWEARDAEEAKRNERLTFLEEDAKSARSRRDEALAHARTLEQRLPAPRQEAPREEPLPDYGDLADEDKKLLSVAEERAFRRAQAEIDRKYGPQIAAAADAAKAARHEQATAIVNKIIGDNKKKYEYAGAADIRLAIVDLAPGLDNGSLTEDDFNRAVEAAAKTSHDTRVKEYEDRDAKRGSSEADRARRRTARRRDGAFQTGGAPPPGKAPEPAKDRNDLRRRLESRLGRQQ